MLFPASAQELSLIKKKILSYQALVKIGLKCPQKHKAVQ